MKFYSANQQYADYSSGITLIIYTVIHNSYTLY